MSGCWPRKATQLSLQKQTHNWLKEDSSSSEDILVNYRNRINLIMNDSIGFNSEILEKKKPNCGLGHVITDAIMEACSQKQIAVDAAVVNYGGIRIPSMSVGKVTLGSIYELMPFDNQIVVLRLSGAAVDSLCQHIAAGGGWPVSSELSFHIHQERAEEIQIRNKPIHQNLFYYIAMSDYIANGGDKCNFLIPYVQTKTNILVRDGIVSWVKSRTKNAQPLFQQPFNRIHTHE
jgi:2',3'-cyclic-nucleotide 2'-phosphodiesterase (5'-nucleotidase family)